MESDNSADAGISDRFDSHNRLFRCDCVRQTLKSKTDVVELMLTQQGSISCELILIVLVFVLRLRDYTHEVSINVSVTKFL